MRHLDVAEWLNVRSNALKAHATQIDPESPFWFGLSDATELQINGREDYILAESVVETSIPEDDLFAGLR